MRDLANSQRGVAERIGRPAVGAVGLAVLLVASVLVVRSSPRAEAQFDLGDGAAWLASTAFGGVSLLDGSSGSIVTSLGVAEPGDDLSVTEWGSDALIVNESAGTVGRLDGSTWTVETGLVKFGETDAPLDVVVGRDSGWLIKPGSASPIDLETLDQRNPVPVAASFAGGAVASDGALLLAGEAPDAPVRRIAIDGSGETIDGLNGPVAFGDLGDALVAVDLDERSVWVEGHGLVCDQLELPADSVLHAAAADGALVIASDSGGIMAWRPLVNGCPRAADFIETQASIFGQPAVADGWAVIPDRSRAEIIVLDIDTGELVAKQRLEGVAEGADIELVAENGTVWFNDPGSNHAGLVRRDGEVLAVAKYDAGADDGFVSAPIDDPDTDGVGVEVAGAQQEREPQDATSETTQPEPEPESPGEPDLTQPPVTQPPGSQPPTTPTTTPGVVEPPTESTSTTSTTSPEEPVGPIVEVQLASTAAQAAVGEAVTFQAIALAGNPNDFRFRVSPAQADAAPVERIGFITYTFPSPGTYLVSVNACDADGNCDSATTSIDIVAGEVPRVAGIGNPGVVSANSDVSLRNVNQGENITSVLWDFGADATPATSTEENPTVRWAIPGTKTVTLTIFGPSSCGGGNCTADVVELDTATRDVTVVAQAPPYLISIAGPTTVEVGEVATYVASTANPAGVPNPHWNVEGAGSSTPRGVERDISWSSPGTYTVRVSADTGSARGEGEVTVTVRPPVPDATLVVSCASTAVDVGSSTSCSVDSSSNTTGESWDVVFPNPAQGSFSGGTLTYDVAGTVQVRRMATHSVTGDPVVSNTVNVVFSDVSVPDPAPSPSLAGPATLEVGQSGSWTMTNNGGQADSISWTASGSGSLNVAGDDLSASKSWPSAGTYTVSVTASGPGGTASDSMQVTVSDPTPAASIDITCDVSTIQQGNYAHCGLNGNSADYSGYTWSTTKPDANEFTSWGANNWSLDVNSFVPGVVTLTLQATHIPTGQPVSDSVSVTFTAPPADPAPAVAISGPATLETGQAGNFSYGNSGGTISSVSWSADGQSGGSSGTYSATWGTAGTYAVTITANGPGGTSSDSMTVTVTDPAPPPPADSPFGMSCATSAAPANTNVRCAMSGDPNNFTGLSWSVTGAGSSWGEGVSVFWINGAVGSMTVTLSGTDNATGNPRSASYTVTFS